jgi:hypothetical protein
MARDAPEGSVSWQTLVVREEGKAPTHFVGISNISNCSLWRPVPVFDWCRLFLATWQLHWPRTVQVCLSCAQLEHGADIVAVKRIGLDGLKEEEIAQLMREVDLVTRA